MQINRLRQLVRAGKANGYVLYDEIDEILTQGDESGAELDTVLSELTRNGVLVLDDLKDDKFLEEGVLREVCERLADSEPLKQYLREVLTLPHLTREDEVELAKRIQSRARALKMR